MSRTMEVTFRKLTAPAFPHFHCLSSSPQYITPTHLPPQSPITAMSISNYTHNKPLIACRTKTFNVTLLLTLLLSLSFQFQNSIHERCNPRLQIFLRNASSGIERETRERSKTTVKRIDWLIVTERVSVAMREREWWSDGVSGGWSSGWGEPPPCVHRRLLEKQREKVKRRFCFHFPVKYFR